MGVVWVEDGVDGGGVYPYFGFFHCDCIVQLDVQRLKFETNSLVQIKLPLTAVLFETADSFTAACP